ncbi:hypothetical protein F5X98DRAFT_334059 [Xylaria grammica]|nr:hypothetical protein F5X98DRAFT_334059 [Xylaria grammica]
MSYWCCPRFLLPTLVSSALLDFCGAMLSFLAHLPTCLASCLTDPSSSNCGECFVHRSQPPPTPIVSFFFFSPPLASPFIHRTRRRVPVLTGSPCGTTGRQTIGRPTKRLEKQHSRG